MADSIAELACNALGDLASEYNEHNRTNHLHREGLAQALRIHEAETIAAQEYHRTEVKMNNEQHTREILQARVLHEYDIDLEKRGAMRENIRDEWLQLSDKAETMFIVNTLVLGTSFAMLIEGSLPASVTLEMHTLMVSYCCALSASICFLLVSVRFAMILRFRVGWTIVEEMRHAIQRTDKDDKALRDTEVYKKCNRPKTTKAACDNRKIADKVKPYTGQVTHAGKNGSIRRMPVVSGGSDRVPDADGERLPAFVQPPTNTTSQQHADLTWLQDGSGFSTEHMKAAYCPPHVQAKLAAFAETAATSSAAVRYCPAGIRSVFAGCSATSGAIASSAAASNAIETAAPSTSLADVEVVAAADRAFDSTAGAINRLGSTRAESMGASSTADASHVAAAMAAATCPGSEAANSGVACSTAASSAAASESVAGSGAASSAAASPGKGGSESNPAGSQSAEHRDLRSRSPPGLGQPLATSALLLAGPISQHSGISAGDSGRISQCSGMSSGESGRISHYSSQSDDSSRCQGPTIEHLDDVALSAVADVPLSPGLHMGHLDSDHVHEHIEKWASEYEELLNERKKRLDDLQERLNILREKWCKPWDRMAQFLFFCGTLALIFAACSLVFCRYGYQQVGIPDGDESFPAAPLAVCGFCAPITVTLVLLVCVEIPRQSFKHAFKDMYKDAIPKEAAESRLAVRQVSNDHEQRVSIDPLQDHDCLTKVWRVWPYHSQEPQKTENHNKRCMAMRAMIKGFFVSDSEVYPKLVAAAMVLTMISNFLFFMLGDALSNHPLHHSQSSTRTASPSLLMSNIHASLELTVRPLAEGAAWPAFWEPAGATWWPSRQVLLLAGGRQLLELNVSSGGFAIPGRLHHVAGSGSMLADVCISSAPHDEESIWLVSEDADFTLHLATEHSGTLEAHPVLQAAAFLGGTSVDAAEGMLPRGSAPVALVQTRAMGCRSGEGDGLATRFWLAGNEVPWPVLASADVLKQQALEQAPGAEARWLGTGQRWPSAWLLVDSELTAALMEEQSTELAPHAVVIEDLEVLGNELMILITATPETPSGRQRFRQVLVLIDASGQLHWWRRLPPPGQENLLGATGSAEGYLLGRWQAVSADTAGDRIFLVAGGPEPRVTVAQLPE